ncbi:MAG: hypothetical protein Fur0016_24410 [Anaerolineales bacterium]
MARIEGTSGSWQAIVDMLAEIGLRVEAPGEIAPLLMEYRNQLASKTAEAGQKAREQLKPIEAEIQIEKENIQTAHAQPLATLQEDIRQAKLHLELFRLDRSLTGRISNLFRTRREQKKLHRLETQHSQISARIQRLLTEQDHLLAEKRAAIETEAAHEYQDLNVKITTLQKALDSKELAQAMLELDMLQHLSALPDTTCVLNGIHLEADSPVKLDGKSFWSAKIHHLVITPAGLFAVGVWQGGQPEANQADPLEQIRRAAHLCYELLKFDFPGLPARAVLAYRGQAPQSPHGAYVKSLPLNEVNGYIGWFKENSLSAEQIAQVVAYFREANS